ncbi:hypothetical protein K435DRAFT_806272 [Dendrothele bispora CBS 962.96]|uniref:Uncharacterized protein n=1 Tax=Dendrothele bispora (strain CBS 962.96) TaxID=1314807 RepID=A0A4S8L9Q1_DENBC|nr:hypothetical protein K435DRAFT_806272 [Dendrothele bispora CBS 962.96]
MSLSDDSQQTFFDLVSLTLPLTFYALLYGAYMVLFMLHFYQFEYQRRVYLGRHLKGVLTFGLIPVLSIIADVILIHRCFKIWGSKKKVIAFPVFIAIINNVTTKNSHLEGSALAQLTFGVLKMKQLEYLSLHFPMGPSIILDLSVLDPGLFWPFLIANFSTNLFIPLVIGDCQSLFAITKFDVLSSAGRVWWIGHQVSKFLPSSLESGIMYPLALIPALVINFGPFEVFLIPILIQVVGIAPTFIIVRVALGISIESVQGTIDMNERNGHEDQTLSLCEVNHDTDELISNEQSTV